MAFGDSVRKLRGDRSRRDIARAAIGWNSDKEQLRHFANYLARIENNRVPNVGLVQITAVAKGFGFTSLRDFFGALEVVDGTREAGGVDGRAHLSDNEALVGALAGFSITISGGFEHLGERVRELVRALDPLVQAHVASPADPGYADGRLHSAAGARKP